jgi:hypothetical protein
MSRQGTTFRGVVVAGRGFGAPRMSQPFDGILTGYLTEDDLGGNVWRDHVPHRQCIRYGEGLIAGRYRGIMFQGDEPEYPRELVEILSDHQLRATLGLQDGDILEFTLLPDQGAGKRP